MSSLTRLTRLIQDAVGSEPDGRWGPQTAGAVARVLELEVDEIEDEPLIPPFEFEALPAPPAKSDRKSYFGAPREGYPHLAEVTTAYPLKLAWAPEQVVTSFFAHRKSVRKFTLLFERWLEVFGEDGVEYYGLDQFGGCYNHRVVRGGSSWSDHAYGAAIDMDPNRNGLHTPWDTNTAGHEGYGFMPVEAIEIAQSCGLTNIAVAIGRDAMHFADVNYGTI